ncbi:retrovirus-related Pol polyprotein from transposon 297 [Nephila pilipes]|uniref:Retrovirus-related Pol polyprotein from transposon 297 n=1 Tax=Nephila pilipes TaxID=299642 RepID=A0A8X6TFM5_NEPPI|nr:retrovirus-related Pol polyprotein from transposon 297 [Nephila pilipes]
MIIDTGTNVTIIRTDLAHKLGEKLIWTPPCITLQTVTGDRINIHGKDYLIIAFGDTMYHHMTELLQSAELDDKQRSAAGKLLLEFEELFSRKLDDVGRTKMMRHRIDTGNNLPIKQHPRRQPFAKQEEVANLLMEMQQKILLSH